ncbi:hypothetical protein GCM10007863_33840 [Dyella mobilis]|nr:hypothetical protein GCM10007863_33840 [Dyella mobilis]
MAAECLDVHGVEQLAGITPFGGKFRAAVAIEHGGIQRDGVGKRAPGVVAATQFLQAVVAVQGEAAKIVEGDLRRRQCAQRGTSVFIQMAQQAIAQAMVRNGMQLFLDALERAPQIAAALQGLVKVDAAWVQRNRIQAGKPADRARKIDAVEHILAAVAFQFEAHRQARLGRALATPLCQRQCECGQQDVVDGGMESGGYVAEQLRSEIGRPLQAQPAKRVYGVPLGIECAHTELRIGRGGDGLPPRQLLLPPRRIRFLLQQLGPAAQ